MLKDFEFYHGVVFTKILHNIQKPVCIRSYKMSDNASYVINDKTGIYIKHSSKRLSPWSFSFHKRHQEKILEIKKNIGEVFLLLVCHKDGIVVLSFNELKRILDDTHEEVEWISVVRGKREMYAIKGSNGELEFKVGRNDFPNKLFSTNSEILSPVNG